MLSQWPAWHAGDRMPGYSHNPLCAGGNSNLFPLPVGRTGAWPLPGLGRVTMCEK